MNFRMHTVHACITTGLELSLNSMELLFSDICTVDTLHPIIILCGAFTTTHIRIRRRISHNTCITRIILRAAKAFIAMRWQVLAQYIWLILIGVAITQQSATNVQLGQQLGSPLFSTMVG